MATRRTPVVDPPEVDLDETGGVRPLEEIVEQEIDYEGVDEVPAPTNLTTTSNFFPAGMVTEIVEIEPELIEGEEPTYKIRLVQDVESIYIGIDYPIPAMKKDVLYEVSQRVYDYLLPKGLIQGK